MILYHASKKIVEIPKIRYTKYTKDSSWVFTAPTSLIRPYAAPTAVTARPLSIHMIMSLTIH